MKTFSSKILQKKLEQIRARPTNALVVKHGLILIQTNKLISSPFRKIVAVNQLAEFPPHI